MSSTLITSGCCAVECMRGMSSRRLLAQLEARRRHEPKQPGRSNDRGGIVSPIHARLTISSAAALREIAGLAVLGSVAVHDNASDRARRRAGLRRLMPGGMAQLLLFGFMLVAA